ncbi:malonyl-CoA:anthocyanidin 5-O-glucoside-6''-O-malonyltransferase-like [Lolium rigidum]|uniref:malonyl-CoA:anthocyanidin 5-O-glucoside-6''-O-malonyltransferase-like n=1 Tax=Lolium rigidum TaxID=89674 RepID=UPI001F5CA943|nr:malonyl-CoA:anthocyanidin 5-O-glucoside-6''-O-malonyltransferase-like [Lolium rigidum]
MGPTQQHLTTPILSVLETTLVAPSPSAGAALPESSLPLTFFDILWLTSPPVERRRVFFYRLTADADVATILSNLQASLSQALHAYYPLAGRLRLKPGTADRYELHYRPGDGVTFTVAEYSNDGADFDELATDEPKKVAKIAPLAPTLPEGGALLALQATVLRGGLAIGVAVHHAACDGASSTRFLHAWSAAGTGAANGPPPPITDRAVVNDPNGRLYDFFVKAMPTADQMERVKLSDDQLFATFTLSKEDIQRVKEVVAAEAARRGAAPPRCSSLVATFGFIWSCYQRAKDDAGSNNGDRPTYLCFPVDHRSRMKPPVPNEYLGNCVGAALHAAPEDQLAEAGAGGIFVACTAVAAAIQEAVGGVRSPETIESWTERFKEAAVAGAGMLTVAGSPRFRVYEVDLGFGRPAKVDIVSVARTGAMAVADDRSSGGGMEVGISLRAAGMQRFQKCFEDAIPFLHH